LTHQVNPAIIDAFDVWLAQHAEEKCKLPGSVCANTYAENDYNQGMPSDSRFTCSTAIRQ